MNKSQDEWVYSKHLYIHRSKMSAMGDYVLALPNHTKDNKLARAVFDLKKPPGPVTRVFRREVDGPMNKNFFPIRVDCGLRDIIKGAYYQHHLNLIIYNLFKSYE